MKVILEQCYKCGACASVCPLNIITVTDKTVKIENECTNCGLCEEVCPVGAIKNEEE